MFRDKKNSVQTLLIVVSLLATLWVQMPRLVDAFRVDEDFRSFYWMNKFQESGLFPDDQLRGYKYVSLHLPWGDLPLYFYSLGYDLLFYAASFFVSPMAFTKILPFLLMPLAVWCLFRYGSSIRGHGAGITLATGFVFLNLASPTSLSVTSGFQRAFASPLVIVLLYSLHRRKSAVTASIIIISSLIYPPAFLISAATWGLFSLSSLVNSRMTWKTVRGELATLLILTFLGALILSPVVLPKIKRSLRSEAVSNQRYQITSSYEQIWNNPRYQPGGRSSLFAISPIIGRGGLVTKPLTAVHVLILTSVGAMICLIGPSWDSLNPPREVWCMLSASLALFAADWISAFLTDSFLLYLPSRYTRVGLFLFLSIFVFLNIGDAIREGVLLIRRNRQTMVWLIAGIEAVALAFILLYPSSRAQLGAINMKWLLAPASLLLAILGALSLRRSPASISFARARQTTLGRVLIGVTVAVVLIGWGTYARMVSKASTLNPPPDERELLAFLETLPKDVLLAGTPCALDNVPLFAKRQILFSCETISQDEQLMLEALDAYYAEEAQPVLELCQTHDIDYLVVNRQTYTEEYIQAGWIFFEPYNQELLPRIRTRDTFALAQVSDDAKVFEAGDYFVVPCTSTALGE